MKINNLKTHSTVIHSLHQEDRIATPSFSACAKILVGGSTTGLKRMAVISTLSAALFGCAGLSDSGPTGTLASGTFLESLSHDGESREYIVYIPSSYDGSEAVPLMMAFHGFGGTAEDFMDWTQMRPLAEQENFIVVFPQGSLLEGSPHWNSALASADNKSTADDLGFVDAMMDELTATYRIDAERIYTSGYSNGSFFSYALACYRSDLVAAVGSVSGTMMDGLIEDCDPSHPTAMINIHGTSDYVVPYSGGPGYSSVDEVMDYWMDANNTDRTAITTSTGNMEQYLYSNGEGDIEIAHYRVNGGGHVWFTQDDDGINASELIWDFVSQFDKQGVIEASE